MLAFGTCLSLLAAEAVVESQLMSPCAQQETLAAVALTTAGSQILTLAGPGPVQLRETQPGPAEAASGGCAELASAAMASFADSFFWSS